MLLANLADLSFREETTRQLKPSPKIINDGEKNGGGNCLNSHNNKTTYPSPRNFMKMFEPPKESPWEVVDGFQSFPAGSLREPS